MRFPVLFVPLFIGLALAAPTPSSIHEKQKLDIAKRTGGNIALCVPGCITACLLSEELYAICLPACTSACLIGAEPGDYVATMDSTGTSSPTDVQTKDRRDIENDSGK